jgi:pimeloyl-ACP methyl ester carboxylesterase
MVMTILHAPLTNYHCFHKVLDEMRPLVYQILLFGYIAAFQLPAVIVKYLGVVGNYAFIRLVHKSENRIDKAGYNAQHSLAMTMGPGEAECRTATDGDTPEKYSDSVLGRAKESGAWFLNCTAYYRDGAAFDKWEKSIDTLGALYNLEIDDEKPMKSKYGRKRRNSSASSALFSDICASSLKAPATIIWGRKDQACTEAICLDGIGDYLARDSQVLMLPKSGHWTPIEKASRETLRAVLERLIQTGDVQKKDLQAIAKETYPNASVGIEK